MAEPEEKEVERNSAKAIQREIQISYPTSPNIQNQSSFFEWFAAILTILNYFAWKRIYNIKIAGTVFTIFNMDSVFYINHNWAKKEIR